MVYRVNITISPVNLADLTVTNVSLPEIPSKTLEDFTVSENVLTGVLAYGSGSNVFRFESTGFVTQELTAQELKDNPSVVLIPSYEISKIVNNGNTYKIKDSYAREQIETLTPIVSVAQLLKYEYFDHIINDQSWLEANTFSWHSGTVYSNAYNHLDDDYTDSTTETETVGSYTITYKLAPDGHKIVPASDEATVLNIYNESGVAWYYILDRRNQRFKLPRENPAREELIQVIRAKGNDTNVGFTDGTENYGLRARSVSSSNGFLYVNKLVYDGNVGNSDTNVQNANTPDNGLFLGITKDSTKSGIISDTADSTSVYKGKKYLYFYVGQYSQSATEQTAGLNAELFNGKVDLNLNNMNPSQTAKRTLIGYGLPDWSAGIDITPPQSSSKYTCPSDGVYCFCLLPSANNALTSLYVNGTKTAIGIHNSSTGNNNKDAIIVYLQKNDQIYFDGGFSSSGLYSSTFYPLKGA